MAKYERKLVGDFHELLNWLHNDIVREVFQPVMRTAATLTWVIKLRSGFMRDTVWWEKTV